MQFKISNAVVIPVWILRLKGMNMRKGYSRLHPLNMVLVKATQYGLEKDDAQEES